MSVLDIPNIPHELLCQSAIYNDTRWGARPKHFQTGTSADLGWIQTPIQPPYLATDTPLMSYDLNKYKDAEGRFKPEVSPDPCIPYHTKYCSFNQQSWVYDHTSPSLVEPSTRPCRFVGKTTVPDIGCIDQQELMKRDQLASSLRNIRTK